MKLGSSPYRKNSERQALGNKVVRKIFASTHEEATKEWGRKAGNYILKTSKILLFIKYNQNNRSRRIGWAQTVVATNTHRLRSSLHRALWNLYIVHSPTNSLLLNLEKFKIYIKIHINIAPSPPPNAAACSYELRGCPSWLWR